MIKIIITGGTFDKEYDPIQGKFTLQDTHLPKLLKDVRNTTPIRYEVLYMKDSIEMTTEDRNKILGSCLTSEETEIIVIHGTDTMVETARMLGQNIFTKTVVLTGAIIPCTIETTDAIFNLGCAMGSVQKLGCGVYVVMNGRIFNWGQVQKDLQTGVFV
jgi:L-asparaginase